MRPLRNLDADTCVFARNQIPTPTCTKCLEGTLHKVEIERGHFMRRPIVFPHVNRKIDAVIPVEFLRHPSLLQAKTVSPRPLSAKSWLYLLVHFKDRDGFFADKRPQVLANRDPRLVQDAPLFGRWRDPIRKRVARDSRV